MNVLNNATLGWSWRRLQEVGGWMTVLMSLVAAAPPEYRAFALEILQGRGGGLSVSAYFGLALYVWSQVQSYRATTRTQIVAEGQVTVPTTADKPIVANVADRVERKPTLLERLFSKGRG